MTNINHMIMSSELTLNKSHDHVVDFPSERFTVTPHSFSLYHQRANGWPFPAFQQTTTWLQQCRNSITTWMKVPNDGNRCLGLRYLFSLFLVCFSFLLLSFSSSTTTRLLVTTFYKQAMTTTRTSRTSTCLTTKTAEAKTAAGLETNNTSRASGSIFSLSFYFTDDYFFDRNRDSAPSAPARAAATVLEDKLQKGLRDLLVCCA